MNTACNAVGGMLLFLGVVLISPATGHAENQGSSDPWTAEMNRSKGLTVGDLNPKYGVGASSATSDRDGVGRDSGTADAQAPDRGPPDPGRLDPGQHDVAASIREWIEIARPPENVLAGANVHYSPRGNIVGTVPGGIISSPHETGVIDPVFLWMNKRALDSVDHCSLEEFVVARLSQQSIAHCAGRYGAVRDLTGVPLPEAKSAIDAAGFVYTVERGSPANTPAEEGTIERQEPAATQYLTKGELITLFVHSPHVPRTPGREERISAYDCSQLNGSRAYWDNAANAPLCGCFDGLVWNLNRTSCVAEAIAHDELCARDYPGSTANGYLDDGRINCECSSGQVWNANRTACINAAVADNERCVQDYPGSYATGRMADGKINCECSTGLAWNAGRTACIDANVANNELCARDYPGSAANGYLDDGRINCECSSGQVWNANRTACINAMVADNERCAQDYPGSYATGRMADGRINCECSTGLTWNANRTGCVQQVVRQPLDPTAQCDYHIMMIGLFMNNFRHNPEDRLQKWSAENSARQARSLGCDEQRVAQALGSGTGGGGGSGSASGTGGSGSGGSCRWVCSSQGVLGTDGAGGVGCACVCNEVTVDDNDCAGLPKPADGGY